MALNICNEKGPKTNRLVDIACCKFPFRLMIYMIGLANQFRHGSNKNKINFTPYEVPFTVEVLLLGV